MNRYSSDKFAICVGRSFGSGGYKFAEALSQRLGVKLYDKNLLDKASEESQIRRELFEEVDERHSFSAPVIYGTNFIGPNPIFAYSENILSNESLFNIQSETIQKIASEESAVFVGRCADFVLREHPQVFSLFVADEDEIRAERVMKRLGLENIEGAREEMEKVDKARRKYYNFFTSWRWGRAETYDMCFKLSTFGIDYALDSVVALLMQRGFPLKDKVLKD